MNATRVLGDYNLIKPIGQGALGTVYLAEHRFMKKQFAVKVFPEDLCAERDFIQRFEEEVGHLSSLDHPHIVKLHNISYDQGTYFLVSDCVVDAMGETTHLGHYLQARNTPLSEEETFRMLAGIAEALDYAHSKGLAHRGIKLNNILVGSSHGSIQLHLSDFGLSRIVGSGTFLTRTFKMVAESLGVEKRLSTGSLNSEKVTPLHSSFLQSYQFLSPEQKNRAGGAVVDTRTDLFSFGVLVYYLLMREFPEGYFEMPSERYPDLQYGWDALIRQCLCKRPEGRPRSLARLIGELKGHSKNDGALRPLLHSAKLEKPKHDPNPAAAFQVDATVKHYEPEQSEEKIVQPLLSEMAIVEGGTFFRGSATGNRDEMPRHAVTLKSFAIDVHPVTNEQFVRFLEAMGGIKDNNHNDIIRLKDSRIYSSKGRFSIESGYVKHPVVGVTWYGACAYAKWVGKRLPTEAEWEVAACGGMENALYPTGDDIEKSQANFFSSDTTPVMSYPANGYALYDIAGNVYEWCQDWYGYNYYETSVQEPVDPQGPLQGVYRVLRGGCWKSLKEDLRCSRRHRNNPGTVNSTYGFRCAADVV